MRPGSAARARAGRAWRGSPRRPRARAPARTSSRRKRAAPVTASEITQRSVARSRRPGVRKQAAAEKRVRKGEEDERPALDFDAVPVARGELGHRDTQNRARQDRPRPPRRAAAASERGPAADTRTRRAARRRRRGGRRRAQRPGAGARRRRSRWSSGRERDQAEAGDREARAAAGARRSRQRERDERPEPAHGNLPALEPGLPASGASQTKSSRARGRPRRDEPAREPDEGAARPVRARSRRPRPAAPRSGPRPRAASGAPRRTRRGAVPRGDGRTLGTPTAGWRLRSKRSVKGASCPSVKASARQRYAAEAKPEAPFASWPLRPRRARPPRRPRRRRARPPLSSSAPATAARSADGPEKSGEVPQRAGRRRRRARGTQPTTTSSARPSRLQPPTSPSKRYAEEQAASAAAARTRVAAERVDPRLRRKLHDRGDGDVEGAEQRRQRTTAQSVGSLWPTSPAICGKEATMPATRRFPQRPCSATAAVAVKTRATKVVPIRVKLAVFHDRHERNEQRADEAERGDELLLPGECDDGRGGGDPGSRDERPGLGDELVERGRSEQRRVAAGDSGADRRHRRVGRPEATAQPEPGREHAHGGRGAEPEPKLRVDPAAVHGQDEEEDDPEHGDDPARDREPERAEQLGEVELAPRLRRARGERRAGGAAAWAGARAAAGGGGAGEAGPGAPAAAEVRCLPAPAAPRLRVRAALERPSRESPLAPVTPSTCAAQVGHPATCP